MPFLADRSRLLVQVGLIGAGKLRAANAVGFTAHPGFKSPSLRSSKALTRILALSEVISVK